MQFFSPEQTPAVGSEPFDVAVVGAHPDDTDVACGGTIAALSAKGYRVAMIDLTDGEPTPGTKHPHQRWEEARAAGEVLGVAYRRLMDLPNRTLMDCLEARVALASEFRRLKPRIVIGFGNKTPLASPDHYQAMQITDAAIFYSRLSKWEQHFPGLPPHPILRQLYFRIPLEPVSTQSIDSNITMDISEHLETKMKAITCFATQFGKRPKIVERLRAAAILTGAAAGYDAGEAFTSPRPLGTQDLVRSLLDDGSQAAALQSLFITPST